jgi:hypothetical protein
MRTAQIAVALVGAGDGPAVERCLGSVLAQTVSPSELLIAEAGADDPLTARILARLKRSGRAVLRIPGTVRAAAKNAAVRHLAGSWILLLEAGDVLVPGYLEAMESRIRADPELDFVWGRVVKREDEDARSPRPDLVDLLASGGAPACPLFRRRVWEEVGAFDETLSELEDLELWSRVLLRESFRGSVLEDPVLSDGGRPSFRPGGLRAMLESLYERHAEALDSLLEDLLVRKEAWLLRLGREHRRLLERRAALDRELEELGREIEALRGELDARGEEGCPGSCLR